MTSILIAGVGGQGTLLASVILGRIGVKEGRQVKVSEVHGMAQRGGSVVTYVRIGDKGEPVRSPLIEPGGADVLLAFELMEAVRWLSYVNPATGRVYANVQKIPPMSVVTGKEAYPDDLEGQVRRLFPDAVLIDAYQMATKAGNGRAVNTVLLGAMAAHSTFPAHVWQEAIAESVKPAFQAVNEKAFLIGLQAGEKKHEA